MASITLLHVRLDADPALLPALSEFYTSTLELPLVRSGSGTVAIEVGETTLEFRGGKGDPFYHFALLVPGDRFDAAHRWAAERVSLLADEDTGETVFEFDNWTAQALYFHDPGGNICELIAHRGEGETGVTGPFRPSELIGFSEVGVVGDPPSLAEELARVFGLEIWSGTAEEEARLAFVGEKARTLILTRPGRPWLPTWRPAEAHPVEVVLTGVADGDVQLESGGFVRGAAAPPRS